MKKIIAVILVAIIAVSFFGCTETQKGSNKNLMFTDARFDGLQEMSLLRYTKALSGEEMQPVIDILQSLTLTEMAEGEIVKENVDAVLLILQYDDGRIETVQISDTVLCFTETGSVKHSTSDQFFENFVSYFGAVAN